MPEKLPKKSQKKYYEFLLGEIKERIRSAQYEALKSVNKELIALYWDIGKMITKRQEGETWGKSIVEQLSKDLQREFPGMKGFSERNLWRMRDFYLTYQKLPPLVAEIGWTHNTIIIERCKNSLEREFYIRMTRKFGWSKNVLTIKIESKTYEKTMLNQTNFNDTLPENIKNQAKLAVKDEYIFDFLELREQHSEKELEKAAIVKIERFLLEMGGVFAFIGSQYKITAGSEEYFIDLLLYHRMLKCLVAIELKIGKFKPEHVGKMQFYLALLDDTIKMENENPSIGIILCKSKDKTIVEYALKESNRPIGIAEYRIIQDLPEELKGKLPEPKDIAKLLKDLR
ncbi:DUF1016 family protein [archaeon]|nr:DUF1016 family protein [archaeon]